VFRKGAAITGTSKTEIGISSSVSVRTLIEAVPSCLVDGGSPEILMLSVFWGDIFSFLAKWLDMKDHWAPSSNNILASTLIPFTSTAVFNKH